MIKKIMIIVLLAIILCQGKCGAEEYVSKANPDHRVYYTSLPAGYAISEYKEHSRGSPGVLYRGKGGFLWYVQDHYYLNGEIVDSQMDQFAEQVYRREMERRRAQDAKVRSDSIALIPVSILILAVIILGIIGIRKGFKDEAVFFVNWPDAIFTIFSIYIFFILFLYTPLIVGGGFYPICALFLGYHAFMSVKFNKSYTDKWGMFYIFMGRILMVFVGMIAMSFLRGGNNKRERDILLNNPASFVFNLVMIMGMVHLLNRLINKERVVYVQGVYSL